MLLCVLGLGGVIWFLLQTGEGGDSLPETVEDTPAISDVVRPPHRPETHPRARAAAATPDVTTPVPFAVVDRLSGRDVPWSEARISPDGDDGLAEISIRPDVAGALLLTPALIEDLRPRRARVDITGAGRLEADHWNGVLDPTENVVWVEAFSELRVHVDATQLPHEAQMHRITLKVLARPKLPEELPSDGPMGRSMVQNVRFSPRGLRRWARSAGLLEHDVSLERRLKIRAGGERDATFFVPYDGDVWVLIPGEKDWTPGIDIQTVHRGKTTDVTLRLLSPKRIQGVLLTEDGEPLPDARVDCRVSTIAADSERMFPYTGSDSATSLGVVRQAGDTAAIVILTTWARTDRAGRFTATFPITDTVVCYCIRGEGSAVKVVELGSRDAEPPFITLRLSAKPSHLRLLDGKGNPLANTSIKFVDTEPRVRLQINYPPVNTDADGWLEGAHFLEPGVRYWIHPTGKMRLKQTFTYQRGTTVVLPD